MRLISLVPRYALSLLALLSERSLGEPESLGERPGSKGAETTEGPEYRCLGPFSCSNSLRFPVLQPQIPSSNSVRSKNLSHLEAILWAIASSSARFFRATRRSP